MNNTLLRKLASLAYTKACIEKQRQALVRGIEEDAENRQILFPWMKEDTTCQEDVDISLHNILVNLSSGYSLAKWSNWIDVHNLLSLHKPIEVLRIGKNGIGGCATYRAMQEKLNELFPKNTDYFISPGDSIAYISIDTVAERITKEALPGLPVEAVLYSYMAGSRTNYTRTIKILRHIEERKLHAKESFFFTALPIDNKLEERMERMLAFINGTGNYFLKVTEVNI